MQLEFGYGSSVQTVELPQENLLGVLHAAPSWSAGNAMRRSAASTPMRPTASTWATPHTERRWTSPVQSRKPTSGSAWATSSFIILPAIPAARRRTPICTRRKRRWTPPSGNTAPPPPSSPCPTAARHCRICRTQAPITAGHNKLKSSRSQMRPAAFSDNMQVQAQMLRPM